jgi:hypothetical protein
VRGSVEAGEPTRHQIAFACGANQGALMLAQLGLGDVNK